MGWFATFARVEDSDALRIRWSEPLPSGAALLFEHRKSDTVHRVPATGAESEVDLASVGLSPGNWRVLLDDGAEQAPVPTIDPGFSLDGLRSYARRGPRELSFRTERTRGGTLRLIVRTARPHAEVTYVGSSGGTVRVEGWTAYTDPAMDDAEARLVAVPRSEAEPVAGTARLERGSFHGELETAPLAAGQRGKADYWDLFIETAGARIPLAALLDDMPGKKAKVRFPTQVEQTASGTRVTVLPYFTDKERLAVACTLPTPEPV